MFPLSLLLPAPRPEAPHLGNWGSYFSLLWSGGTGAAFVAVATVSSVRREPLFSGFVEECQALAD